MMTRMVRRSVLRVLTALLMFGPAHAAAEAPDELARQVFESVKLSLSRLETVVGDARFSYVEHRAKAKTHRVHFWFRKPFEIAIRETADSFHFSHRDGTVVLYFPRELDVLKLDLSTADTGIVRRLVKLAEIENFTKGFGMQEFSSHFRVKVLRNAVANTFEAEIGPLPASVWKRVVGLHHIKVTIDAGSHLPSRVAVFHRRRLNAPAMLAFEMELLHLATNIPIRDSSFVIPVPSKANPLSTSALVKLILDSSLQDGRELLQQIGSEVGDRLRQLRDSPWDF